MYGLFFQARKHIIATNEYFEKRNLIVLEIRNPEPSDWIKNPFKQSNRSLPNMFWFLNFDMTYRDHKIIVVTQKQKAGFQVYWRQVKSSMLIGGHSIKFMKSIKLSNKEKKRFEQIVVKVTNKCPACDSSITISNKECPDCGINFQ